MQDNSKMHPDDIRNLLLFAFISIALWLAYNTYVVQPQREAMMAQQQAQQEILEAELQNPDSDLSLENLSRDEILTRSARIEIDTDALKGSLSLSGASLDDIALKQFNKTLEDEDNVDLLSPRGSEFPRSMSVGWVASDQSIQVPNDKTVWSVQGSDKLTTASPVTLYWISPQGLRFEKQISVDENYLFTITQRVINRTQNDVTLFPYGLLSQTGVPADSQATYIAHEGPIGWVGNDLVEHSYKDLRKKQRPIETASQGWIGVTDKYWLSALIPAQGVNAKYRFTHTPNVLNEDRGRYQVDYTGGPVLIPANGAGQNVTHLYAGAKEVLKLQDYGEALGVPNFDLAVDFGMFFFLTKPFFYILHFLGEHVGNMGIAIIILTIMIRMAVFPLTSLSYRSFAKMKKVAPQISELKKDHGEDKQRLQQEIIQLYQREGVNPMAGCFPILLQIPIFFALYKVFFTTIEMRHEPFFGWIKDLSAPDPTSIFNLFGVLPFDVPGFLLIGIWPCLMCAIMLVQKKLNPPPQDKLQRDMMNIFPFFITFIMARFASGLVIYWTFSALISVLQQMYIMKSLNVPIHLFGEKAEEEKIPDAKVVEEIKDDGDDEPPPVITPPKPKKSKKKKK